MAHDLEQAVSRSAVLFVDHDQRLVDEPAEDVELTLTDCVHRV